MSALEVLPLYGIAVCRKTMYPKIEAASSSDKWVWGLALHHDGTVAGSVVELYCLGSELLGTKGRGGHRCDTVSTSDVNRDSNRLGVLNKCTVQ
jgi:hypothetical protein